MKLTLAIVFMIFTAQSNILSSDYREHLLNTFLHAHFKNIPKSRFDQLQKEVDVFDTNLRTRSGYRELISDEVLMSLKPWEQELKRKIARAAKKK